MKSKKLKLVFHSKMRSAYWFFSLIYAMFEVIQGLFFHPYQTVQFLVKKKLFKILIFFPVFCLLFIYLLGLILGEFGQYGFLFLDSNWVVFIKYWIVYFCILWQMVLFYLFFRFWYAWRKSNKLGSVY